MGAGLVVGADAAFDIALAPEMSRRTSELEISRRALEQGVLLTALELEMLRWASELEMSLRGLEQGLVLTGLELLKLPRVAISAGSSDCTRRCEIRHLPDWRLFVM